MILKYFVFCFFGGLFIWFLQRVPFFELPFIGKILRKSKWFSELINCDLCLGFWVFFALAWIMQMNLLGDWFVVHSVISSVITGAVSSFFVHLIKVGWNTEFREIHLE